MKTRAAVLRDVGKPFEIVELDLDEPRAGEVMVKFAASGLCHSDDHLRTGDIPVRYPIVGGHEGAGIVEQVGEGVTRLAVGDHVVASFLPVCGKCRFCARGQTNLCDYGRFLVDNCLPDGTFRYHEGTTDFGQMCLLGTFSQRAVLSEASVVKIEDDIPLVEAALVGCGVPTGFGSAVKAGEVKPGDTTVVYGVGGVGVNALQGASIAGARYVISGFELSLFEKRLQGALFGSSNPFDDIPRILDLYRAGKIKLSELITTRYTLDQVNQGYEDMMAGRNIRGVIIHA
jgi:Zn-dependent alcohol dehydrogenase